MDDQLCTKDQADIDSLLLTLASTFTASGDDPDYLADVVARQVDDREAEKLRGLFQAVGQLLDVHQTNSSPG